MVSDIQSIDRAFSLRKQILKMPEIDEEKEIDSQILNLLDNKSLNGVSTYLRELRRARFIEERYFELFLRDKSSRVSSKPIISGLYFAGRGKWIKPWAEIRYFYQVTFSNNKGNIEIVNLADHRLDIPLFRLLSQLIPAGGHLSVEYEKDETEACLRSGIHPVLSPLGYLLWKNGFRWFKDWYFPEGWREGGTKLQGNKPLDKTHKKKREQELKEEIELLLKSRAEEAGSQTEKKAIARAYKIREEINITTSSK